MVLFNEKNPKGVKKASKKHIHRPLSTESPSRQDKMIAFSLSS